MPCLSLSTFPVVLPCFHPHPPFPFVFGVHIVCVPFWAFSPSLSHVAHSLRALPKSMLLISAVVFCASTVIDCCLQQQTPMTLLTWMQPSLFFLHTCVATTYSACVELTVLLKVCCSSPTLHLPDPVMGEDEAYE